MTYILRGLRKADGLGTITSEDGDKHAETFQCKHCGGHRHVKIGQDPYSIGGLCGGCGGMICGACVDRGVCDPIEKQLERMEARHEALRSYGF